MSDPLRDKIIDGLVKLTDREKFEACAADLLRKLYPRLVAMQGGSDAGFDGAAQEENGDSIQLVCTTGKDVLRNLNGSLTEAKKKGRKSNSVIVATSQRLTGPYKQKLIAKAAKFGKTLYPIYDQQPIANLLYHDSRWRKALLNLLGNPPALSHLPANHRPTFEIPPLGRDKELTALTSAKNDLVVVGQPGSGKTHLLTHAAQENGGLFAVTDNREALADSLRDQQPKWVIVDDAFTRLDELIGLRQMRTDMGAEFRIIATCWPMQEDEVAAKLAVTGQKPMRLLPLPMKTIKELVTALHITGPDHLLHEILHQSAGKPGLTVTLCQLCWQHGTKELFTGEALTRDVRQSLTTLAGEDAVRLLAHFALSGDTGLTIEEAAKLTEIPPIIVAKLTEKMGAAGVLEVGKERRLSVEPARLRQALVRDIFCKPPAALDWRGLLCAIPNQADAVDTLIAAGLLGGTLDDLALRQEINGLRASLRHDDLCDHYARLGPAQSRWIMTNFPGIIRKVATPLLTHIPKEAIPLLLRASLTEGLPLRNSRDELSQLRHWIAEVGNRMDSVPRRILLLDALEAMHDELRDTPTLLAALRHVLSNQFEWTDQQPGESAAFRVQHGFVPIAALEKIATLWPRALPLLTGLSTTNALQLPKLIEDWANPRPWGNGQMPQDYSDSCRHHARVMIADLARSYASNWIVLYHFQWIAERAGYELPTILGLPIILFPPRSFARDEQLKQNQDKALEQLAIEWNARGPEAAVIEEWLRTHREAINAGINYPNLSRELAWQIAQRTTRAEDWLQSLIEREAPSDLVAPFIERCRDASKGWPRQFVVLYLNHPVYGSLALELLLRCVSDTDELWRTAVPVLQAHAQFVANLAHIDAVPETTILKLLTDFGPTVAGQVAVEYWSAKPKGDIPAALLPTWRAAVVNAVEDEYQMDKISQAHPDLACAWLKHRVNQTWDDQIAGAMLFDSYNNLPAIIASLTPVHRREVINHFAVGNHHGRVLAQLVGDNLELFRHALARPETAKLATHCLGIPGTPPDEWLKRAVLLLDSGLTEEDVLWASEHTGSGGEGPWSRIYEEKLHHFLPLLTQPDPRIRRIGETACAHLRRSKDEALEHERIAAVKGVLA